MADLGVEKILVRHWILPFVNVLESGPGKGFHHGAIRWDEGGEIKTLGYIPTFVDHLEYGLVVKYELGFQQQQLACPLIQPAREK